MCRYYYNENGFLTQIDIYETDKTSPVSKYLYIWDNDKLIARQVVSYEPQDNGLIMTSRIIYDADDEPQGFILLGEQNGKSTGQQVFLYRKNLQGDITGIIDSLSGQMLVEYAYDAYGNAQLIVNGSDIGTVVVAALATAYTPLLYRGYVYTNLGGEFAYYLGSRFYVPQLGRFLNADKYTDTGTGVIGTNMFAYCNNNPVMNVDPSGELANLMKNILNAFSIITSFISSIFSQKKVSWIYAVSIFKLTNKQKHSRTHTVVCNPMGLKFAITIHYTLGTYKKRPYVIMTSFDLDFISLGSNYSYDCIEYSYGCTSTVAGTVGFSQNGSGITTEKHFTKKTPINWMAVNIVSYEEMKAFIGATVEIELYSKDSNDSYTFYYMCLTDEYDWNVFNDRGTSEYFGYGNYDAKWGIYV